MDEGADETEGPHGNQDDQVERMALPSGRTTEDQIERRPEHREAADEQPARNQPGREIRTLHMKASGVGDVTDECAEKQRQQRGKQNRLQWMKGSCEPEANGDHGDSSRARARRHARRLLQTNATKRGWLLRDGADPVVHWKREQRPCRSAGACPGQGVGPAAADLPPVSWGALRLTSPGCCSTGRGRERRRTTRSLRVWSESSGRSA